MDKILDIKVGRDTRACELIELFRKSHGFLAADVAEAVDVLKEGASSDVRILAFTGNLIATGLRGIISQLIGAGLFNVIFTTTGALDHDIARAMGGSYLRGSFDADDRKLRELDLYRLGNVLIPADSYGELVEAFVRRLAEVAAGKKRRWGTYELARLAGEMIRDENSFLRQAHVAGADIFVPGWPDGAFGTALFMESQRGVAIEIDYFIDMKRLSELFFGAKKASALILGGGISKHHAIWWAQFKGGLDYAVYITTATERDGSLSGARHREAISWGKISPSARSVTVQGDVTVILPLIASCLT